MRKGSYAVGGAEVAITAFPGDVGGVLANVNRWRGQAGLAPVDEAGLGQATTSIESNGLHFLVVDAEGGSSADRGRAPAVERRHLVLQADGPGRRRCPGQARVPLVPKDRPRPLSAMAPPRPNPLALLTSLRLTVVLLVLSIVLVFAATLDQVHLGVWGVQEKYFRSFFVFKPDRAAPAFLFPVFPGGYLLGGR